MFHRVTRRRILGADVDAEQRAEGGDVVVGTPAGREIVCAAGGNVQQTTDEVSHGLLGAAVVVAACAHAGDLVFEHTEGVLTQRDDGGREALAAPREGELLRGEAHDLTRLGGGLQLFERGVQPNGLEIEQIDTGDGRDIRVDVAGQAEVDHQASRPGGVRNGALRGARRGDAAKLARQFSAPALQHGRIEDVVVGARAGDDEIRGCRGPRVLGIVDGCDAVLGGEDLCAPRGGENADAFRAVVAQCGERCRRVGAGADEQDVEVGPVRDAAVGQFEREAHEGAPGAADRGGVLDAPLCLARTLEEALELCGRRALASRIGECAAHLARDLALTDDDGLEARCDGEQVLGDIRARDDPIRSLEFRGADACRRLGREQDGFDADGTCRGDGLVHVDVRLEAVARRQHDGSADARVVLRDKGSDIGRVYAEPLEQIECGGLVTRRDTQQHPPSLPAMRSLAARQPESPEPRYAREDGTMHLSDAPLLRALRGDRPDRAPVWFMRQAGRSLPEYRELRVGTRMLDACLDPELASEITLQPVHRHHVDAAIFFSDIVVPLRLAGVEVEIEPGRGPVFASPVRSAADVARLTAIDPAEVAEASGSVTEAIGRVTDELGTTPLIGFAGAPFTLAAYLVEGGPSKEHMRARAMMHADPSSWHALADWLGRVAGVFLDVQVRAGASAVQLFDSWAGSLSRADYRAFAAPHSRTAVSAVAGRVPIIHFGVGTGPILDDMRLGGLADAVGVDWRTTLDDAARVLGPDITVQGNIDPALLQAPWPVLEAHVRDVLERGRAARAHILNLGHGVTPDTDPDVLTRIVRLAHGEDA